MEGCTSEFPFDFVDFYGDDYCCPEKPFYDAFDGISTCQHERGEILRYQGDF